MSDTPETIQVPICVSGGISAAEPSICMDGATHMVNTPIAGSIRVLGTNRAAIKALNDFEGAKMIVTVCGYPKTTVNCSHIEAYYVGPAEDAAPVLKSLEQD